MQLLGVWSHFSCKNRGRTHYLIGGGGTGCSIIAAGVCNGGGDYWVGVSSHITGGWISSSYNLKKYYLLLLHY